MIRKMLGWGLLLLLTLFVSFVIFMEFIAEWKFPSKADAIQHAETRAMDLAERVCPNTVFYGAQSELELINWINSSQAFDVSVKLKFGDGKIGSVSVLVFTWAHFGPIQIPSSEILGYGINCNA